MSVDAFFLLHSDLPREGPGSDACTREALRRLPPLPASPRVLDLGCGPGAQSLVLAESLGCRIVAIDLHRPFLDRLQGEARARGLGHLIEARQADMGALEIAPGSVDLLWSEGAVYILGFVAGLRRWRPLLVPGSLMAVSECCWLTDDRPAEAAAFWSEAYPAMANAAETIARAETEGFDVLDSFALPHRAWWDAYYTPLLERIERLRPTADAALKGMIAETEREIGLYRRHGDAYGYVFYLLRKRRDDKTIEGTDIDAEHL